jgi:hypothetical protein
MESGCRTETFFTTLGGPQAHDSSGRDDNSFWRRVPIFQEKYESPLATNLSSRPERSVVERAAVWFTSNHSGFGGEVALLGAHHVAGVEGYQVDGAEGSVQLEVGGTVG